MIRILLVPLVLLCSWHAHAQDLGSLFDSGKYKEIIDRYNLSGRSFDQDEMQLVAGAYDRFGRVFEESQVLSKIFRSFPLFLTYSMPANYIYHANLIKAGRMEKFRAALTAAYSDSIKDPVLGLKILAAFYADQAVRFKWEDLEYSRKLRIALPWDSAVIKNEWAQNDSANATLIAGVIRGCKGFPSKSRIGIVGTYSMFILMQHLAPANREQYDRLLFEAACKHDITMTDYAMYRTMTLVRLKRIPDASFQQTLDSLSNLKCR